ncbi:MAG: hypothetical protein ABI824_02870 [Acidobacteriota bacterium]
MLKFVAGLVVVMVSVCAQSGIITTFAGGYPVGIPGPAISAALFNPHGIVEDAQGNLIILDKTQIYKLAPNGQITLMAGTGVVGFSGDGGPAVFATLNLGGGSDGVVVDPQGNVIFSDADNYRIRKISPNGTITTIAGSGQCGSQGDGVPALQGQICSVNGITLDKQGNLFLAEWAENRVRRVSATGVITTVAGDGSGTEKGDGGLGAQAGVVNPIGVVVDSAGNLLILENGSNVVRKLGLDGKISTVANSSTPRPSSAEWGSFAAFAIDAQDNLYLGASHSVLRLTPQGTISVLVGNGSVADSNTPVPALTASIGQLRGLTVDSKGNVDTAFGPGNPRVGRVSTTGQFVYIAGTTPMAALNGPPAFARIINPGAMALDPQGNLNVEMRGPLGIFKLTPLSIARNPGNYLGAGGYQAIAFDQAGNLYRTNSVYHLVQKVDPSGKEFILAGKYENNFGGAGSSTGDGGPATDARLGNPRGIALAPDGSFYFSDSSQNVVRKVAPNGIITTVVGGGSGAEGTLATSAKMNGPTDIIFDSLGNLYIADTANHRVLKVTPGGNLSTFAGGGTSNGDLGPATQASVPFPFTLAVDAADNIYVAASDRIRKITKGGIITTVAGTGITGYSGDGGPGTQAMLNRPQGIAVDAKGNLYIGDYESHRVRIVQGSPPFALLPGSLVFPMALNAPPASQTVKVVTTDGATRQYQIKSNAAWLSATPSGGTVTSSNDASISVTADPTGLVKGTYLGLLTILDPDENAASQLPVTMTVSGTAQQLRLSQSGLAFKVLQNGNAAPPLSVQVLNTGSGSMPWTATPSTTSGGAWLSVQGGSGTAVAGATPGSFQVTTNAAGLAPGSYYGVVNVLAPSADNSPNATVVLLNVLPADGSVGPQVNPAGLLFTAAPNAASVAAQKVELANITTHTISYTASVKLANGTGWLAAPASGSILAGQTVNLDLAPQASALTAGVYRATITFSFSPDNVTRSLEVAVVVSASATVNDSIQGRAATTCIPTTLVPVIKRPGSSYQTAAGWPVSIEATIVDDCRNPMTQGQVKASFSTNDPAVSLLSLGDGTWQTTWSSRTTQANLTVTLQATNLATGITGKTTVAIRSDLDPDQPAIFAGGVVNAASFGGEALVSPGEYVSIFGALLAREYMIAPTAPLPTTLGDTSIILGGKALSLYYISDGQVNAILPYGIPDSTKLEMRVQRGNVLSLGEQVLIGSSQPGVFAYNSQGFGQGHVYLTTPSGYALVDSGHPAKAGDAIIFFATGLGPVDRPVVAGQAPPNDPYPTPTNPIEVTIQGLKAKILFVGLLYPGVFQLNVEVPPGVTSDPFSAMIVRSAGQAAPAITLATSK